MKSTLSHAEYAQVLAGIEAIHRCRTLADFPQQVLAALSQVVPSNLSAFNEVNVPRNRMVAITDRPLVDHARLVQEWERYSSQHPLLRYYTETGDGQAVKISDFLSASEYHRLDIYRAFYRVLGAEDQMTLTIRSEGGIFLTFAFNRACRDFRETDRVKLNLLRPHILQAYANAEELAGYLDEKRDLQTALREIGHGMIAIDTRGEAARSTPGALDCLARYFPRFAPAGPLPLPILHWLRGGASEPFTIRDSTARLILRSAGPPERRLLLLSEENVPWSPARPHLTARESEVLGWLAEGKTNPEIAVILGVAAGTVKMHVERILDKLGVDNRTAATVFASEAGLVPRRSHATPPRQPVQVSRGEAETFENP
jgi:DNA-binding CsgD family transcriptional regulator